MYTIWPWPGGMPREDVKSGAVQNAEDENPARGLGRPLEDSRYTIREVTEDNAGRMAVHAGVSLRTV